MGGRVFGALMAEFDVLFGLDMIRLLTGIAVLGYASYTDWKSRTAPNILWFVMGGIGALLLAIQFFVLGIDQIMYLIFIPIMWILMYVLFQIGVMFGGADAKAIMALALLVPLFPSLGKLPIWESLMPFSWVVFVNALLLFLAIPVTLFFYNLMKKDLSFPQSMLGYRMPLKKAKASFVWPMEHIVEGKMKLVLRPSDDDLAQVYDELEKADVKRVWVTPKIPFMIPLLAGFVVAFVAGDILSFIFMSVL